VVGSGAGVVVSANVVEGASSVGGATLLGDAEAVALGESAGGALVLFP
jgi:hypothetical protein